MNATVGTILDDEEINRILWERNQECFQQKSLNVTLPPGKNLHSYLNVSLSSHTFVIANVNYFIENIPSTLVYFTIA